MAPPGVRLGREGPAALRVAVALRFIFWGWGGWSVCFGRFWFGGLRGQGTDQMTPIHSHTPSPAQTPVTRTFHIRSIVMLAPSTSSTRPRLSAAASSGPAGAGTSGPSVRASSRTGRKGRDGSGLGTPWRSYEGAAAGGGASREGPAR